MIFPYFTAGLTEYLSHSERSGLSFSSGGTCVLAGAANACEVSNPGDMQRPWVTTEGNLASAASLRLWQSCWSDEGRVGKQKSVS